MNRGACILILGATSAIAQAYARRRAPEGAAFVLVGRDAERLAAVAADLLACGAASADAVAADLSCIERIEEHVHSLLRSFSGINEVLIAFGLLEDQAMERDLTSARRILDTNFTSAALWILALLRERSSSGPLSVAAIGSVAGDRGRASNFLYGAAKGGLERFIEGLTQKYDGSAVRFLIVKPGFVDTPMTAGMRKSGLLWVSPDRVARDIHSALLRRRRVIYSPWFWRPIMAIIRHMPWFLFKRLKV